MKRFLLAILLYIPIFIIAQNNISGVVLDSATQQPMPYVTVYINGTTQGTITDRNGNFELNNIPIPSEMVVSHVGYFPEIIDINNNAPTELKILLRTKNIDLSEVIVENKNLRKKNMDIFKQMFIGEDYWGENTQIENDSVLTFNHEYSYRKIILNDANKNNIKLGLIENIHEWDEDSLFIIVKELSVFRTEAHAPLNIDMPLLGYKLQVDLVDFTIQYTEQGEQCFFLGYYFFQHYNTKNKSKLKKFEKQRKLAYYNSGQHFLQSIFNKKIAHNGYELLERTKDTITNKINIKNVNIDVNLKYSEDAQMQITGFKNRHLYILFHPKRNDTPVDLTSEEKTNNIKQSEIFFLNDTCMINSNGTFPNYSIMFAGEISDKKVGAFLPDDYVVKNN